MKRKTRVDETPLVETQLKCIAALLRDDSTRTLFPSLSTQEEKSLMEIFRQHFSSQDAQTQRLVYNLMADGLPLMKTWQTIREEKKDFPAPAAIKDALRLWEAFLRLPPFVPFQSFSHEQLTEQERELKFRLGLQNLAKQYDYILQQMPIVITPSVLRQIIDTIPWSWWRDLLRKIFIYKEYLPYFLPYILDVWRSGKNGSETLEHHRSEMVEQRDMDMKTALGRFPSLESKNREEICEEKGQIFRVFLKERTNNVCSAPVKCTENQPAWMTLPLNSCTHQVR